LSCCNKTYDLGCIYHCNQLIFGTADFSGTVVGVFTSGNIVISQSINVVEGGEFIFDMSLLNEEMAYTLKLYVDDEEITVTIDEIEYDCFAVKTTLTGTAVEFVPVPGCTAMCEEIYDPTGVGADVFDYNNMHTGIAVDGVTITGDGTTGNPLVAVGGGGGTESDPVFTAWLATNPLSAYAVAGHTHSFADITSKPTTLAGYGITDAYPLTGNPSGFLTSFTESDPIFSASAASGITGTNITNWNTAYGWGNHGIAGYLTGISGMMVTSALGYTPYDSSNPSGYITASSLSGYLTAATASSTYEPKITAGTTSQYWRGDKSWQTLDKTAVGLGNVENTALSTWAGSTNITTLGTVTSGTWTATAIGATRGGTGQTTYATGDILYASAANTLSKLAAGTNGHVLTLAAGVPTWAAPSGGGSGWGLTGNAGTTGYPSNFMGTTDNQNVIFKRNNAFIFELNANGIGVGINTSDNKYIEVKGSTTGNPATGYSYIGYGGFQSYTANNYAFSQANSSGKVLGIGIGTDGITRIATGTTAGKAPAIYINDAFGGNGNVGIGGSAVTSAKLALTSTTTGFLPPVMTTTQRDAISSPDTGLMIYDSTANKVSVYNGSVWKYLQYE